MKVQKYEISRTIDKLKSIVQKNDQFPALGGVLVKDGYLIASNTEMTMQLKLEASKGSCFIIPMKAFDVIKNLPDGEVIIDADGKNIVTIKTKAIKNKYQSYPPEEFSFDITEDLDAPRSCDQWQEDDGCNWTCYLCSCRQQFCNTDDGCVLRRWRKQD